MKASVGRTLAVSGSPVYEVSSLALVNILCKLGMSGREGFMVAFPADHGWLRCSEKRSRW